MLLKVTQSYFRTANPMRSMCSRGIALREPANESTEPKAVRLDQLHFSCAVKVNQPTKFSLAQSSEGGWGRSVTLLVRCLGDNACSQALLQAFSAAHQHVAHYSIPSAS